MGEIISREFALVAGVGALVILLAIGFDLLSGWRKAKERGEARTSYALSRTITKMVMYYSGYGIALCIDTLLHVGRLWQIVGCDVVLNVPAVGLLIALFLCFVELLSIRESADDKMKKRFNAACETLVKMASKSEMAGALADAIVEAMKRQREQPPDK